MSSPPPPPAAWRYSRPAIVLHWTLALMLAGAAGFGWFMMTIEHEPGAAWYFELHKSFGIVIALLVVLRVVWRLTHPPAPLPAGMPAWQTRLAGITQALLYLVMVALPLVGYVGASYSKAGVKLFGAATPAWAVPDHDTAEQFFDIHSALVWVLVALVVLHVAGALLHRFRDRNGVFERMHF